MRVRKLIRPRNRSFLEQARSLNEIEGRVTDMSFQVSNHMVKIFYMIEANRLDSVNHYCREVNSFLQKCIFKTKSNKSPAPGQYYKWLWTENYGEDPWFVRSVLRDLNEEYEFLDGINDNLVLKMYKEISKTLFEMSRVMSKGDKTEVRIKSVLIDLGYLR